MSNNICNYCKNAILSGNNIYYAYDKKYCTNECRTYYIKTIKGLEYTTDNIYKDANIKFSSRKSFDSFINLNKYKINDNYVDENYVDENNVDENYVDENNVDENICNNTIGNNCNYNINFSLKFLVYIVKTLYNLS